MKNYLKWPIKLFLGGIFLLVYGILSAQTPTQSIKGTVIDKDTRQPLAGATIMVTDQNPVMGVISDAEGAFFLANVPVGRHSLRCQFLGYEPFETDGIIISSVKELVMEIELIQASVSGQEVKVTAYKNLNDPVNDLAVVSSRSFSPEETSRYAGSVNDPGRMALSFPGVQQGRDDGENDIIIRGNSSVGMLWRLEGIDIPNPNHFARPGTSGGGITVFSAQVLGQSDFFSGGLPAEYGNALSGAMDVHFRKGNRTEREYRAKIGLLGMDFMAEGPFAKGKSSYLVNYRYSTLGLLSSMGFYLVGERVTNNFQDLSFNLAFDGKSGKDFFTVFGIGGLSTEHYQPVEDPAEREPGVANNF
ncbi:MAG: carboxypeptidase-like regulatory domain-containing protein, partial [Bacteroidia bacterium]|nr:carboxypeptidase-like regulatory domain-containing protein [Bacteroidia bacterium]